MMQEYENSNRLTLKSFLFLISVLFVAFLPISSFLFSLKNDAFTGYFPPKFFMSASVHAGYLPLWNPYINFGIPQYGDMSSGYWSPITWLIAATVGYTAYTFTLEALLYILLGGIGMYLLTGFFKIDKRVCLIAGVAYMCCGFNVGHLQHFNWLSGAAFLPWCFWSYLLFLKQASLKNILGVVILFYFLISSAHPGIIIGTFYFFLCVSIFFFITNDATKSIQIKLKNWIFSHSIFLILLLLLSTGMIVGYLDIIPFFVRGEKISLLSSLSNPTSLQSWISTLIPFATVKNDLFYNTDISMRNCYFSITLFLFFLLAIFNKKEAWQKFLLILGLIFALLSSGGFFKTIAYKFIPFIGYVRLNGEFRIFSVLCFIIIGAIELNKFIHQKKNFNGAIKWIYYFIEAILLGFIFTGIYKVFSTRAGLLFNFKSIFALDNNIVKLKALIEGVSFFDTLWIQGIIQLLILWNIKRCIKTTNWNLLVKILVVDMVFATLLNIPFTGVGKDSVAHVQMLLNESPKGIPIPALKPINNIASIAFSDEKLIGNWSMYNKQIGVKTEVAYPIILKNMNAYFLNIEIKSKDNYLDKPFIFILDSINKNNLTIKSFSPNKIVIMAMAGDGTKLVLQQNFYPHWFYNNSVNKNLVKKEAINFMSAPLVKGQNTITFSFEPTAVIIAMMFSAALFVIYCSILLILSFKKYSVSINKNILQ